jgi:hypothetical protein
MLQLLDVASSGYTTLSIPGMNAPGSPPYAPSGGCARCLEHRPVPSVDGSLHVGPDIRLPSPGMDVVVEFHYNSASEYNGPYGYRRSISQNLLAPRPLPQPKPAQVTYTSCLALHNPVWHAGRSTAAGGGAMRYRPGT